MMPPRKEQCSSQLETYWIFTFLNDNNIMRVGGRFAFSGLAQEQKNPIILAKEHFFTKMVVLDYHERHHHTGVDQTHFELRERFWNLQSRQLIRKLLCT